MRWVGPPSECNSSPQVTQSKGKTKSPGGSGSGGHGVRVVRIDADGAGQRVDNLLLRELKGVPRSRVYSMLRKGEVRVNGGRIRASHRLDAGDEVRLPPWRGPSAAAASAAPSASLSGRLIAGILHDDADLLVMDKPAGLAVHGGSGIHVGLVEALRQLRPEFAKLELVHRIDRDTSGVVLLAKRRSVLRILHTVLRERLAEKRYLALVEGEWPGHLRQLDAPLERYLAANGERFVRVSAAGKPSLTRVRVVHRLAGVTLIEAAPESGRTHQIRVHLAAAGHPILGDPKYADTAALERHAALGVMRLCLHAASIEVPDWTGQGGPRSFEAPLPEDMTALIASLARPASSG
ncbi:MAG: RluA family pseudouridine synthase [Gammaproteobacteria bacterium]|nr:RluA family pseudouridine synthase [Gammaproteobacteria bacterium]